MKQFFPLFCCLAISLFLKPDFLSGQCNTTPCGDPVPQANPMDVCVVSSANELNCYIGTTTTEPSVVFPAWCGNNINTQWFAFTANAPTANFVISNAGCSQGTTIQAAAFSTSNCVNFSIISNCVNVAPTQNSTVFVSGMVPGQVYYLCVGGGNGALCEFRINPVGWSGPAVNCVSHPLPGLPYQTTAADAVWSTQPPLAAIFNPPTGLVTTATFLEAGTINVCINSPSCPEFCLPVEVAGGDFHEYVDLCQGKTVECYGHTYSAPGTYTITEPDGPWCTKTTYCHVTLVPTTNTTQTVFMCQNGSATCAGEEFGAPGTYPVTLQGFKGCDSIVTCKVNLYPPSPVTNLTINMCGPAEYTVCGEAFSTSGVYTQVCTNFHGCDSIINLNLAILNPDAIINPPDSLTCEVDTIILNGTNSPPNTALGGSTSYNWSGPGIIGPINLPTVKVNQPGTYCLIVRHARGALACSDTACVVVKSSNSAPSIPQISGNFNPCKDSTYIYTATSNGSTALTAFNWSVPGNLSYTTLTPNSIQVNWDTIVTGPLCVTAQNSCGTSSPSCKQIAVQLPVQQPVMNGPGVVCAGGGAYLFTLNPEQPGAIYNWTFPPGAVLTGTGDSVNINFLNAVSGQVCVTPQNACGAGVPVCRSVQVNPVPSADLSSDAQICAGTSVDLHFTLTGNSPFDVIWSVNNQSFTLNNIANGHIEHVTPSQTTVYKITNISDNSTAACASAIIDSVTIMVLPAYSTTTTAQICSGATFFVGGGQQTSSGIYADTLQTLHGCDSIMLTTLTVLTADTTILETNTCDPALAGFSTQIFTQLNGCDSVVISITTFRPPDTTLVFDNSCNPANVGVFMQHLNNQYGCDSTVIRTVTFALSDTTLVVAATCDPAAVGVFYDHLLSADGCDSLVITTVSLIPGSTTQVSGTTCNPANAGIFTNNLTNQMGCDSTVITTITFVPLQPTFQTATTCDPALAGVFTDYFTTVGGCDSVVTTTVTLLPGSTTMLSTTTCNPAQVGVFTNTLTNYLGCDSTIITTVTLSPLTTVFQSATTCDPASVGIFTNHFTTAGGCDSMVTTTVSLLPSSTTMLTATTCNPAQTGVFTNVFSNYLGCDSTVITTVTLSPLPPVHLSATTCDPAAAGVFTSHFTTAAGCDSVVIHTISLLPDNATTIATTTCNPALAGVFVHQFTNQYGCDSVVTETRTLLPGSMTTINLMTCDVTQVGSITQILPNQYGCDSTIVTITSLSPANSCSVAATLTGSDIPCGSSSGTLTLTPTVGTAPFSYTVLQGATMVTSGSAPTLGVPQVISGLPAGNYTVNISSPNGFSTTAQAVMTQLTPPNLATSASSNYTGFGVSCIGATDGSTIATASGGLPPYTFSWSNGGNTQQINNIAAGIYTVTVIDANGCTNVSTVALTSPEALTVSFIVNNLDCFGQDDGAIQVNVSGGAAPYLYSLNNGPEQSASTFPGLTSGLYTLTASDANGCHQTEAIGVNGVTLINVDLGEDITIGLGESATLQATVNVPLDSILSAVWSPGLTDSTECTAPCLTQTVTPLISTVYSIKVQSISGCTDEDNIAVMVDRRRQVYVPNVFTPGDDAANNLFTIYARPGSVSKIISMQVFDRWGDAIITLKDFLPNSATVGWDGRFNNKPVNPGVFVWIAEIEFVDGQREIFKGDVTVVR